MENNIASILFARGIMPDDFISYSTYAAVGEIVKEMERLQEERNSTVYIELGKLWNLLLKQGYGNDLNILATFHKFREQFKP